MTERRPHWDQELEQAVSAVLFDCYENGISEEQVYQVIAAVEDWHEKFVMHGAFRVLAERAASAEADRDRLANQLLNEVPDSYIQMKARALTAEATIQRVREFLADKDEGLTDDARAQGHFILVDTDSVRRALDGDA
jgi:hypothetical protein